MLVGYECLKKGKPKAEFEVEPEEPAGLGKEEERVTRLPGCSGAVENAHLAGPENSHQTMTGKKLNK